MGKWKWANASSGSQSGMRRLSWAVEAGDQKPKSGDDTKCGDHYIEEGLECHDGDAHRPTPGKNPYWQGGRKGPKDKSKKSSDRDKSEVTPKTKERKESREKEGGTPEQFAKDRFNHYANMLEKAWKDKTGQDLEWNEKRAGEVLEMVMRDTAREFSLDSGELGFQDKEQSYYGPLDNFNEPQRSAPKKGYKGRSLWRPRSHEKETTTPRDGGGNEQVPPAREGKDGLFQKTRESTKDRKPSSEAAGVHASDLDWSTSKIMQERMVRPVNPGCPGGGPSQEEADLMALNNALPPLPGDDQATGRPCGDGEDPKKGHCNPNIAPPTPQQKAPQQPQQPMQRQTPMSDDPKALRKLGGPQAPKPKGVGLGPQTSDQGRQKRTMQHTLNMKNTQPGDTKKNAYNLSKMFQGSKIKQEKNGLMGTTKPMDAQQAKVQYDDARHTLESSGWKNTSEMGGKTTWSKGGANISLLHGVDNKTGQAVNKFMVHNAPKKEQPSAWKRLFSELDWS